MNYVLTKPRFGAVFFAIFALFSTAHAGMRIENIEVELESSRGIWVGEYIVINKSKFDGVYEISVSTWDQVQGENVFSPTKDLYVTPPVVKIKAGEQHVVRVISRRAPDLKRERSYRVKFTQIAREDAELPLRLVNGRMVRVAYTIDVIAHLPTTAKPNVDFDVQRFTFKGKRGMLITNRGGHRLYVAEYRYFDKNKKLIKSYAAPTRIIARGERFVELPEAHEAASVELYSSQFLYGKKTFALQ